MLPESPRWQVPAGQHFLFADFDDGIVMFDVAIGSTHLINPTAAETLTIVERTPGLGAEAIYRALLAQLELDESALPRDAVIQLLWQLEISVLSPRSTDDAYRRPLGQRSA